MAKSNAPATKNQINNHNLLEAAYLNVKLALKLQYHTICTVDENWPILCSLPASPLHSWFDIPWLRCPCIPSWDTQIRMPFELRFSGKFTSTIYNSRVTRRQFLRWIRPPTDIHTLTNLMVRLLTTGQSAQDWKDSNQNQVRTEHDNWPNWDTPIWVFA